MKFHKSRHPKRTSIPEDKSPVTRYNTAITSYI